MTTTYPHKTYIDAVAKRASEGSWSDVTAFASAEMSDQGDRSEARFAARGAAHVAGRLPEYTPDWYADFDMVRNESSHRVWSPIWDAAWHMSWAVFVQDLIGVHGSVFPPSKLHRPWWIW